MIRYPKHAPTTFNITSSISAYRPVKNCKDSNIQEKVTANNNTLKNILFFVVPIKSVNSNPNGKYRTIFKNICGMTYNPFSKISVIENTRGIKFGVIPIPPKSENLSSTTPVTLNTAIK